MSQDFIRPPAAVWDRIASESTNPEMLRENIKAELERTGVIERQRGDGYNDRLMPGQPAPAASSLPANNDMRKASETFCRYVIFDNSSFELFGGSEEELNQQEAKIRAVLSGRS